MSEEESHKSNEVVTMVKDTRRTLIDRLRLVWVRRVMAPICRRLPWMSKKDHYAALEFQHNIYCDALRPIGEEELKQTLVIREGMPAVRLYRADNTYYKDTIGLDYVFRVNFEGWWGDEVNLSERLGAMFATIFIEALQKKAYELRGETYQIASRFDGSMGKYREALQKKADQIPHDGFAVFERKVRELHDEAK